MIYLLYILEYLEKKICQWILMVTIGVFIGWGVGAVFTNYFVDRAVTRAKQAFVKDAIESKVGLYDQETGNFRFKNKQELRYDVLGGEFLYIPQFEGTDANPLFNVK